ncbi:MAG TPA: type II toxin-antitoxin system PemK/MazF family toxin, partial [Gemmataceae bacterium]|nr:type II toxin-antitoxin system PemK/MazF family toxin [Gemmataceae bacterium]
MNRGDVLLARFPHPSGGRGKKRPVVVVQADAYNQALRTLVVAEVTKNLNMATDPACLFIDASTPEGQGTGVVQDSVVSCLLLATIKAELVDQVIGVLSPAMKQKLNACLIRLCQLRIGRKKVMRCRSFESHCRSFRSRRACSRSQSHMRRCTSG